MWIPRQLEGGLFFLRFNTGFESSNMGKSENHSTNSASWNRLFWSSLKNPAGIGMLLSEGSCLFRDIMKEWQSTVCYGVVRGFFLQVCQCVWEIKRVDEKPMAPLKVKLWGVSGAAACSSTVDPGADPCTGDASAPVARGSSSGDPAFGDNSAATPPGAQFFCVNWKKRNDFELKQVSIYCVPRSD